LQNSTRCGVLAASRVPVTPDPLLLADEQFLVTLAKLSRCDSSRQD